MSDRITKLLQDLVNTLDDIHQEEPVLHRLWLESLYVQRRSASGGLSMPSRWRLSVFALVHNGELEHRPAVAVAAKDFAESVHRLVCHHSDRLHLVT
jgi:hypothetical protein